jgi:monovalent cation:H+ antiporter-2, CPA2 family
LLRALAEMIDAPLSQILILLAVSVLVIAVGRRLGLPTLLGYLFVGLALGPFAAALFAASDTTRLLSELGIVFLLFTLGLDFSLPRMVAMRREVFGLGALQVSVTAAAAATLARLFGVTWPFAVVIGGAVAMSSTVIIVQQLTEQAELNRTHGRLAFSMTLFQDLAFVPFLALASALASSAAQFTARAIGLTIAGGAVAVALVLVAGRLLLRPLLYEIAHSRLRELFTLAVLFVVLSAAWVSHLAGLSLALGAFLAGMMLAETEYRHQVEAVIRPFRDILLGLFFISVGMLLDVQLLFREFWLVSLLLAGMLVMKGAIAAIVTRIFVDSAFKALRTGVVMAAGGEFGIALLTILVQGGTAIPQLVQPLLVAIILSIALSPFILRSNKRIARLVLGERGPPATAVEREDAATEQLARREHVILCGFGRVGQSVARVLETQGFEYIALDLDPARIRAARQAGDPVVYGDSADEEVLERIGLRSASAVVITFAAPAISIGIVRTLRRLRADVPILVRTQDDSRLADLKEAGATEVVPETFEASLMLLSQALMLLRVPVYKVVKIIGDIRSDRYAGARDLFRSDDAHSSDDLHAYREELKSVVIPPGAWSVGRTLEEVRGKGADVAFTGIRREGILGREPSADTCLREGDIVVIYGQPEELEHAENVLLAG